MESVRMMVAKATAQDKGFAARWSSRLTYLLVMLSPHPDGDRARLATDPFGPRPEHPDRALGREEAPARARDLPASPNLVNLRNDNNTSKSQIARTMLATVDSAAHRNRYQWSGAHIPRLHATGCASGARGGGALF